MTGCSTNQPTLELINVAVDLTQDQDGEESPELKYDFVLKNVAQNTIGGAEKPNVSTFRFDDSITLSIEPQQNLRETIEEISGVNVFSEDANLGMGRSGTPFLEPNQEASYTIHYSLGASAENSELGNEQLETIKQNALDAVLIVSVEEEEVARFDLNELNDTH